MIDLHTHSTFSDGTFTPEQLVAEAARAGISALALTDHDSVDGIARFMSSCAETGLRGVTGVEISVDCSSGDATMHILGYFIDPSNGDLANHVNRLKNGRVRRNDEILRRINALGMSLSMKEVESFAGEKNVGRLHFAQALMARGYVGSTQEAFDKYLGKGKSGYAERLRFHPEHALEIIRNSGGISVLAHPFTLKLDEQELAKCVERLVSGGLGGLEVYYPQHAPKQVRQYLDLARRFNIVATGGTDFHGAVMPDIKLGVGFGSLRVPDSVLEQLDERRN